MFAIKMQKHFCKRAIPFDWQQCQCQAFLTLSCQEEANWVACLLTNTMYTGIYKYKWKYKYSWLSSKSEVGWIEGDLRWKELVEYLGQLSHPFHLFPFLKFSIDTNFKSLDINWTYSHSYKSLAIASVTWLKQCYSCTLCCSLMKSDNQKDWES